MGHGHAGPFAPADIAQSDVSHEAMLRAHVASGSYVCRRRNLGEQTQLFWGYWESREECDVSKGPWLSLRREATVLLKVK